MKLYILFAQHHENYEGEHAPEAVEVMDEYSYEENAEWLYAKKEEYDVQSHIRSTVIVAMEVNQDEIRKRLLPKFPEVTAKLVDENA